MRTIELAQTQSGTKKEPLKKALNLMAGLKPSISNFCLQANTIPKQMKLRAAS